MQNKVMTKPTGEKQTAIDGLVRAARIIKADATGELPSDVMLIKAGNWPDSVKGNLTITVADLHEYKTNFDRGVGRPGQGIGLPIDFSHNEWSEAAAWINELEVRGNELYSVNTEWTTAGKEAILGGMFKCISPSFYPAGRGGWSDPEDLSTVIENVLVGAGLTNIPFFKELSPVRASVLSEDDKSDNIIYVSKSASAKETEDMSIDEIRVKDAAALSAEEKQFLADNKALLSADEQTKFGLVEAAITNNKEENKVNADTFTQEEQKIIADIRAGQAKVVASDETVVKADTLAKLEASAEEYQTEKAKSIVEAHVARGALKSDQLDYWTGKLKASAGTEREALETALSALPSNEKLAEEIGTDNAGVTASTAREQLAEIASNKVAAAAKEGRTLSYGDALKQAGMENAHLQKQDLIETGVTQ